MEQRLYRCAPYRRIILIPLLFLIANCWAYIPTVGRLHPHYKSSNDKEFIFDFVDLRLESCLRLIKDNDSFLVNKEFTCKLLVQSFFNLQSVSKKLNENIEKSGRKIYVKVEYSVSKDRTSSVFHQESDEETLDFFARGVPIFTLSFFPGWALLNDDMKIQIIEDEKVVLSYYESGSAYQLGSILLFPFFFFRSIDDVIAKKIEYSVIHHYSVFETNKKR